ncbi:hypothetical protein [Goodfellowiella coeruleoviolacea]|nr:hypothetical protein [Goodfellowiella coeruleoviolacea]
MSTDRLAQTMMPSVPTTASGPTSASANDSSAVGITPTNTDTRPL